MTSNGNSTAARNTRRSKGEVRRDMVYATGIANSTAITALINARRRVSSKDLR
ncbi:hypothetical protein D3C80_2004680 [compost metagenome]